MVKYFAFLKTYNARFSVLQAACFWFLHVFILFAKLLFIGSMGHVDFSLCQKGDKMKTTFGISNITKQMRNLAFDNWAWYYQKLSIWYYLGLVLSKLSIWMLVCVLAFILLVELKKKSTMNENKNQKIKEKQNKNKKGR